MVPPGQKDVSSDAVIFSTSPVPLTSGLFWLIQSDQRLTQVDWPDAGVVGTTLIVVGDGVVPCSAVGRALVSIMAHNTEGYCRKEYQK